MVRGFWTAVRADDNSDDDEIEIIDVELEDTELLDEVDLTASLIVAANQSDGPLSVEEIDRLLGLR